MAKLEVDLESVTEGLIHEILGVMGLGRSNWAYRLMGPFFRLPARRMSKLLVNFNNETANHGWKAGASLFLLNFIQNYRVTGIESIPKEGPLLIVSNHPAAYDVIILAASLPREDLKIIGSDISIIRPLQAIAPHFILVSWENSSRIAATRAALRYLMEGGVVLTFPRGEVEPDAALFPGAVPDFEHWSPSLELLLRKVPQTKTVISIVSGVLSGNWLKNPIIRIWRKPEQRQKIAEVFQVIQQLFGSKDLGLDPIVSYSRPFTTDELGSVETPSGTLLNGIIEQARILVSEHGQVN